MVVTAHNTKKQPNYCKSVTKYLARELHIGVLYPLILGRKSIPEDRNYWYLCNVQDNSEGSEIRQLTKQRDFGQFAKMHQCYGVDFQKNIIKKNKKYHPESNWICEEWTSAIRNNNFNPSLVYLDTTYFGDRFPAVMAVTQTMQLCPTNTLLIANVMMANPRAGTGENLFDQYSLVDNILTNQHPEAYAEWNVSPDDHNVNVFHSYEYRTSKTTMRSYIFYKGVLPKEEAFEKEFFKYKDWCSHSNQQISI